MQQKGKTKDTAVLRTLVNAKAQNFATKRLLKDLQDIDRETIPTVGVTARPLEHDLFIWHANIKADDGPYKGVVLHLELVIPESYPHQPPEVTLLTPIEHPNVFGNKICLDLIQGRSTSVNSVGWSSGYSIQSVLLQLQSFLFVTVKDEKEQKKLTNRLQKQFEAANQYKCGVKNCKHGGSLSCWPAFSLKEVNPEAFIQPRNEWELLENSFVCFHTKLPFKAPTLSDQADTVKKQESALGILLQISKIPRTGSIKNALPSLDYISIKAFLNEGVKWDTYNNNYTHWIPLLFGKTDNLDRVLHLLQRSVSMIMTNSTRRFKPEFIIEVFPKITQNIVFSMMDEKQHASIRNLRILSQVHALWLIAMEKWPQLYDVVDNMLEKFITDEKFRNKDNTPNLGILLNLLYVSKKYTFKDIIDAYLIEQLDRQVFWLVKEIPELLDEKLADGISAAKRVEISFKQQKTSFLMGCFQFVFLNMAKKPFKTNEEIINRYMNNFCLLGNAPELAIQKRAFEIQKTVNNYDQFYDFIEYPKRGMDEQNELLKQAFKNSKAKKYHGTLDEMNKLPPTSEQIQRSLQKVPQLEEQFTIEKKKDGKSFIYQIQENQKLGENEWKQLVLKRWDWIENQVRYEDTNPTQLAVLANQRALLREDEKPKDRLYNKIKSFNQLKESQIQRAQPDHTWKQLFMKLDLEEFIINFDKNPDFQTLYTKINIVKQHIVDLRIILTQVTQISSGYHFITSVIEDLLNLKQLTIGGTNSKVLISQQYPKKAAKAIFKGLQNLSTKKNSLEALAFEAVSFKGNQNEVVECIFQPIQSFTDQLKSIRIVNSDIISFGNAAKQLGSIISRLKLLEELIIQNGIKSANEAKEFTDGLMRAKQLKYVDLSQNVLISEKGLAQIVYNLSFSPKLTYLNISRSGAITGVELVESLYKLLKINGSIEELHCSYLSNLAPKLSLQFFQALGENRTLKYLNIEGCGELPDLSLQMFGKAVAFNSKLAGSLSRLGLKSTVYSYQKLNVFLENMQISDHSFEKWYGDEAKANKMTGEQVRTKFYCGLNNLDISGGNFVSGFSLAKYRSLQVQNSDKLQSILQLPNFKHLNLSSKFLNKSDAELLSILLIPQQIKNKIHVQILDLSKNKLGKDGAKIISHILEQNDTIQILDISSNQIGVAGGQNLARGLSKNRTLQVLNLFHNMIGFDGAQEFGKTLQVNTSLRIIDFGNNRIRNKGLLAIQNGILSNKDSKIETLGLRFNFLTEDVIIKFFKQNQSIKELYIKNNSINDYGLLTLSKAYEESKSKIRIDLLEKQALLDESRLERTVWVQPNFTIDDIIRFYEANECGVVLDARTRKGLKYPNRVVAPNIFNFVEFADPISVNRALNLAATQKAIINGKAFRIYKAGTGTFIYQKKSAKQKKAETSKTKVAALVRPKRVRGEAPARGRGAARGAGRGRGR